MHFPLQIAFKRLAQRFLGPEIVRVEPFTATIPITIQES